MRALIQWLLDLLYPPKCMLCHRLLDESTHLLCGRCGHDLPKHEGGLRSVKYFVKGIAPFYYEGHIRDSILRFKFYGMQAYAQQYARWMSVPVEAELKGMYDVISWVPCSPRRRWARGFDQCELLAKALAKEVGSDCLATLKKVRHTEKQSRMSGDAARRANVLDAYQAYRPDRYQRKKILLVDDVLTTGATISECGKILRLAGSGELVCAAIAAARHNNK
ncbi:MAG: ComF family protein [Oscillospiraceae bacterium]|nr:ComF family protein [Oscillospiraceae bacterium]